MQSLPLFHQIAGQRVVIVGGGEMGAARRRLIERAGGVPCNEAEAHHAWLGFVAIEDRVEAEAVARRLKGKGLLVNVTDRPELCDFTMPSILDRDPVLIAVGTGGASAGLAKQLRLRLEAILPASLGALADALSAGREKLRTRLPDAAERRRAVDTALSEYGALDPLNGESAARVDQWIRDTGVAIAPQLVTFTLISDDPDDLTLRQARLLGVADVIVHDAGISEDVLARARADAVRIPITSQSPPASSAQGITVVLHRD